MEVSTEDLEQLHYRVTDTTGIRFTDDYLKRVLDSNPSLAGEVIEFGASDTVVGESAVDAVAQDLLGRDWPLSAEMGEEEFEGFIERFKSAANQRGAGVEDED